MQCDAACRGVLQCVAACCVAVCCVCLSGLPRCVCVAVCDAVCDAVWCSVSRCVAACCSVLCSSVLCLPVGPSAVCVGLPQCVCVAARVAECDAVCCGLSRCVAVCGNMLCCSVCLPVGPSTVCVRCSVCCSVWCSVLQRVAVCCSVLQRVAACCVAACYVCLLGVLLITYDTIGTQGSFLFFKKIVVFLNKNRVPAFWGSNARLILVSYEKEEKCTFLCRPPTSHGIDNQQIIIVLSKHYSHARCNVWIQRRYIYTYICVCVRVCIYICISEQNIYNNSQNMYVYSYI